MRDRFAEGLLRRAEVDDRIVFVTADLGYGVFEEFRAKLPNQYLNVGVAEQNMIAVATGLAMEGFTCFVYSIGNFATLRCLEQIRNDAAYHGANVKIVSIGGGFSYGPLGMSHHATEDIAVMTAIPAITTLIPGTKEDVTHCVDAMLDSTGTCYLRLDKSAGHEQPSAEPFSIGRWRVMREGDDVALVAAGGILAEAQLAAELLEGSGVKVRVVSATQPAAVTGHEILRALGDAPLIVTVEEHVIRGGIGGIVAEAIAEDGSGKRLVRKGLPPQFIECVGSQQYLRSVVGLDASSLVDSTLSELGR